jgi:hypothetical protein
MALIIEQAGGIASTGMFEEKIGRVAELLQCNLHLMLFTASVLLSWVDQEMWALFMIVTRSMELRPLHYKTIQVGCVCSQNLLSCSTN